MLEQQTSEYATIKFTKSLITNALTPLPNQNIFDVNNTYNTITINPSSLSNKSDLEYVEIVFDRQQQQQQQSFKNFPPIYDEKILAKTSTSFWTLKRVIVFAVILSLIVIVVIAAIVLIVLATASKGFYFLCFF